MLDVLASFAVLQTLHTLYNDGFLFHRSDVKQKPPTPDAAAASRKPSDPLISNPMYGSSTNMGEMTVHLEERRKSNASQAAANPMYSSIGINPDTRRSFNVRRGERVDGVQRSQSSAASVSRRTRSSREVPMIPPAYTTVVPKDLRKKERPPSQTPERLVDGEAGAPIYSDIEQVNKITARERLPTPPKTQEELHVDQVGFRGKEPSPLVQTLDHQVDMEAGGPLYSDIDQVNGRKGQLTPSARHHEDQMGLRGKEPSPSPEQVAADEANGEPQPPLYSVLDQDEIQRIEPPPAPPPEQREGGEKPSEPLYSAIHDHPVTPPARNKTHSVSQERKTKPVGGAEGGAPGEDEYSTLKHITS